MKKFSAIRLFLTGANWAAVLLTLMASFPLHATDLDAETEDPETSTPTISGKPIDSPWNDMEASQRRHELVNYMRTQVPGWLPGLPDTINALREDFDFIPHYGLGDENHTFPSFFKSFTHSSDGNQSDGFSFAPGYRHMQGMTPFNDAMILGFNYRQNLFADHVNITLHPFYGQNWLSSDALYGTEISLGLGPDKTASWGKIVARYDNGAPSLMENGTTNSRGFDMHTEFMFDQNFNLTAGVQRDEGAALGNYVLLQWQLSKFYD